jgi:hypothetical protein
MQETDNHEYLVVILCHKKHDRIVFSRRLCCMFFLCVILIWEAVFMKMVEKTFHHAFAKTRDTFSLKGVTLCACHVWGLAPLVHYTHHLKCSGSSADPLQALKFEACCAVCWSQCLPCWKTEYECEYPLMLWDISPHSSIPTALEKGANVHDLLFKVVLSLNFGG